MLRTLVQGKRRDIGLGGASYVSLAEAREAAQRMRGIARQGGDPVTERNRQRRQGVTFEAAARRVHKEQVVPNNRNAKHIAQWLSSIEAYVFPHIGPRPIDGIDQADVLRILEPIWTSKPETARRVRQRLRAILDWARTSGLMEGINPVEGVERGLPRQRDRAKHFAAVPWQELPELWPRLTEAKGLGALALRFAILTAARSGEVRGALWEEFDLATATWTISEDRMKTGLPHRVPLSPAVLTLIDEVREAHERLLFPSSKGGLLSDMTLSAVLKRLEVSATVHGFRSSFRDWAEEATPYPYAAKEAALAHTVRNKVEAAYRRSDLFDIRRQMMDGWAEYVTRGSR
jgi:integrase